MRIDRLEIIEIAASPRGNWIFVKVHTDDAIYGLGEASQSGDDALVSSMLRELGETLADEDPAQVETLWEHAAGALGVPDAGRVAATAVGAIDQALWDIAGQVQGQPVWKLLGGTGERQRIRLYANLNRGTEDRSSSGFADAARRAVQAGFSAVKSTPFDEVANTRLSTEEIVAAAAPGLDRLQATREAIGPDVDLLVDCHRRFDLDSALEIAKRVESLDLFWFEEPVPDNDVDALCRIAAESRQRIAGGELLCGDERFAEYTDGPAVQILMPDIKHAGGLTPCRRVATAAAAAGIPISPHNPSGPVSTMASAHLAAAIDNFLCLEYAFGEVDWRQQLSRPAERIGDSHIELPQSPGLGVELDETVLAAHRL